MKDQFADVPHVAELLAEYERLSKEQLNLIATPCLVRLRRVLVENCALAHQFNSALEAQAQREAQTWV